MSTRSQSPSPMRPQALVAKLLITVLAAGPPALDDVLSQACNRRRAPESRRQLPCNSCGLARKQAAETFPPQPARHRFRIHCCRRIASGRPQPRTIGRSHERRVSRRLEPPNALQVDLEGQEAGRLTVAPFARGAETPSETLCGKGQPRQARWQDDDRRAVKRGREAFADW